MLTIFNRRELLTLFSTGKYMGVCQLLNAEHIPHSTKFANGGGTMCRRSRGSGPCQNIYTVFVHKDDYDRAARAIQPALRNDY